MKVRFRTVYVNCPLSDFWNPETQMLEVELPDGVTIVGCHPSTVGYELVLMEEIDE